MLKISIAETATEWVAYSELYVSSRRLSFIHAIHLRGVRNQRLHCERITVQ